MKNKLTFLFVASLLAMSSLTGCSASEVKEFLSSESKTSESSGGGNESSGGSESTGGNESTSGNESSGGESSGGDESSGGNESSGGETSSGNESSGGEESSSGGEAVQTEWTADQVRLMEESLYGIVLPFVGPGMRVSTLHSDETPAGIIITGTENMERGFLSSYAQNFYEDEEWQGGDYSYELGLSNGNAFAFVREVQVEKYTRHISVMFTGINYTSGGEGGFSQDGRTQWR